MRVALVTLAAAAGLAAPAQASAHARGPTVAIDYRLRVISVPAGVHVRILDGDRSVEASVDPGSTLLVTGLLHEPMLRIDGGVWANQASPTAHADRVVTNAASRSGWVQLSGARSFSWHDHRLTPAGPRGRFAIGVRVNGRPAEIAGSFVRVSRPPLWPWLAGVAAFGAAVWALAVRPARRLTLTVVLGLAAGAAALATSIAFAVRDRPGGGVGWLQIGTAVAVALALVVPLVRFRGRRRAQAAGVMGAVAAAVTIALLPVFWHGVVISALPGDLVRFACALALAGGASAAALSLLPEFDG
jgi:hypothetical protein